MNRKEWCECTDKHIKYYFMNKARQLLRSGIFNSNPLTDENATVIHHLRDTEEQRKYNDEHYEMWGHSLDGTFDYGRYVVFWTKEHHDEYHHGSEETNNKRSNTLKNNPPFKGRHHSEKSKAILKDKCSGWHHSERTKSLISELSKSKWNEDEFRLKMQESKDENFSKAMSKLAVERWHNDEYRQKQSESHSGKKLPDETRRKMSESRCGSKNHNYGKALSDDTKLKISAKCKEISKNKIAPVKDAYKKYKEDGGLMKWNEFQKLCKESGSLYNAYTQKDAVVRPEDILCLSQFNNENDSMYNYTDEGDLALDGIKKVSIDHLDDISNFINVDDFNN